MYDPLSAIRSAIDSFDLDRARQLIRDELQQNPTADLYMLAAEVAISDSQRREFLQKAVALDPLRPHERPGLNNRVFYLEFTYNLSA